MSKPTEPKYSKKTSFSRNKKYATSEMDIQKYDRKIEEYKNVRSSEREYNLKIANGINNNNDVCVEDVKPVREYSDNTSVNRETQFYFEKMNFVISGIPSTQSNMLSIDTILREFSPYGKIIYVTQLVANENGYANCKLVIDHWYDEENIDMTFIIEVQNAILKNGIYNWFCVGDSQINIARDPEQTIRDMGAKIELEETD